MFDITDVDQREISEKIDISVSEEEYLAYLAEATEDYDPEREEEMMKGLMGTMNYIERNGQEYLNRKRGTFVCDHCLKEKNINLKAPYTSGDEDYIFCWSCIDAYQETGEW